MRFPVALVLAFAMAGLAGRAHSSESPWTSSPGARAFSDARSLNETVLRLALNAAACARRAGAVANDRLLTVIDYSKASTEPRLWVLDLERERVLFEELVAHGRGSGENFATQFSNREGSHQTSLGLFRTADTYVGSNGYSLRLDGLEAGVNDRARERAIVMHGAPYVSEFNLRTVGRLGRSHGCPALRPAIARTVIDTIKQGSLVFAYYPDKQWLQGSRFLNGCS
jgi:L,D-transpeptidase catalytic domain